MGILKKKSFLFCCLQFLLDRCSQLTKYHNFGQISDNKKIILTKVNENVQRRCFLSKCPKLLVIFSTAIVNSFYRDFNTLYTRLKIPTIADSKLTKSIGNFENKQPNCTILFIFVYQLPFIDCILSKIVGFDQLWTAFHQKLVTANRKLVSFKMPNTFCRFTQLTSQFRVLGLIWSFGLKIRPPQLLRSQPGHQ